LLLAFDLDDGGSLRPGGVRCSVLGDRAWVFRLLLELAASRVGPIVPVGAVTTMSQEASS
jgi:hypothetical protein